MIKTRAVKPPKSIPKEEGSYSGVYPDITDRFHLVQDVADRIPHIGPKGDYLKQIIQDKLIEHKHHIDKHGQDMPGILRWKWANSL